MPIYDYTCDVCSHRFEARQGFHDDPLTECPQCSGRVRRIIHPSGVIFKGSGWYITDSRKSNSTSSNTSTDRASAPAEDSKSEAKTSEVKAAADD